MSASPTILAETPPVLLDTNETAALLRCSPATLEVDRCRRRWRVPFMRVGRSIRYDRAAVLRWLADRNPAELVGG
jgi:hypothetical protein